MTQGASIKGKWEQILSREEFARQGQAVRAAAEALTDTAAVRVFLNRHHSGLRGRPLDIAIKSASGLKAVETAIRLEISHSQQGC